MAPQPHGNYPPPVLDLITSRAWLMTRRILRRAGVLEEIRNITSDITSTSWRKLGGEILVHIEGDSQSPDKPLLYPVHLLSNMLLERVLQQETASVHMSHAVIDVGQSDDAAWVRVKSGDEVKRIEGDFVIGCDGAKSVVRKSLFGDDFPGFTWDKQLVVTNVRPNTRPQPRRS